MKVTRHAKRRLLQRTKGYTKHKNQLANRALRHGVGYKETRGAVKRYITYLFLKGGRKADNIRILDGKVFIIQKNTLLTVLNLPERYREEADNFVKQNRYSNNNFCIGNSQSCRRNK